MIRHYVMDRKALERFVASVDIPNGWDKKTKTLLYLNDKHSNDGYELIKDYDEPSDAYFDVVHLGLLSEGSEAVTVSWGWATAVDDPSVRRRIMVMVHVDRDGWTLGTLFQDEQDGPIDVQEETRGVLAEFLDTLYAHSIPLNLLNESDKE